MRSLLSDLELREPRSLNDALTILASEPGQWRPFAGGTDLMVLLQAGKLPSARYLNLWGISELRGIDVRSDVIVIGALTTYAEVLRSAELHEECPLICQAAAETGGVATQNRGTIGGNVANASPAADTPPTLLVYDAILELISVRGTRRVPYDRFHHGYKRMDLAPDELIRAVHVVRGQGGWRHAWRKVGTRRAQAISKICIAAAIDVDPSTRVVRDIRLAFGSVAPTVVRATHAEAAVRGQELTAERIEAARAALARDITPIDDIRSSAEYRLKVAGNLVSSFLR